MIYLKNFKLLNEKQEYNIICYEEPRKIFNNTYPFHIFPLKSFSLPTEPHGASPLIL